MKILLIKIIMMLIKFFKKIWILKLNLLFVYLLIKLFILNLLEMKIRQNVELGRLIGKVDNDFNISESDWIPRAAAWVIDALSQMKVLPMERKRRTLNVDNRIALF